MRLSYTFNMRMDSLCRLFLDLIYEEETEHEQDYRDLRFQGV